jgi:hypothetical protein
VLSSDTVTGAGAEVKVTADADLGAGVETIEETFLFTVIHPRATLLRGGVTVVPK